VTRRAAPPTLDADALSALTSLLRPFIRSLAVELAVELDRARLDLDVDQRSPALAELRISPRAYLTAARGGAFPSSRRGRLVVARRRDVEAWLEARGARGARRETSPAIAPRSVDDDVRDALGLRLVGGAR